MSALAVTLIASGGSPAGAATPTSASTGRFLSGTAMGTSFDTVASLDGESAKYPGNPGPNQNDLKGSVLGMAFAGPAKNVSVPFPGGVTFGAVGQYARADSDGTAAGSSGLIGRNGAINVAGSGNNDVATIDLANLPGASSLTSVLGDLTLTVGAVSGHAVQPALGKAQSDPSANCTGGTYERVSSEHQAGSYQFANLTIAATSPALKTLGSTLITNLGAGITQFGNAFNSVGSGAVKITGLPDANDLASDLSVSLADGGVTASLADGSVKIDLAKILKAAGLDINNLCPNTSLVSYLAKALSGLPTAINKLITSLSDKFTASIGNVKVTVGPLTLSAAQISTLLTPIASTLAGNFQTITTDLDTAFQPAIDALSDNLLNLVGNAQDQSGKTFTETALQLQLIPNGGSLPSIPGLPSLPGLPTSIPQLKKAQAKVSAEMKNKQSTSNTKAKPKSTGSSTPAAKPSASTSAAPKLPVSVPGANFAGFAAPAAAAPRAAAPGANPVLQLNLGQASVTADSVAIAGTSTTPTPAASGTDLPTGVPAGLANHGGGTPALPILAVIALLLAGGGAFAYRRRVPFRH